MNRVVIGMGSNIDPQKNIAKAKKQIAAEYSLIAESKFVETEPIGVKEQPNFINGAILIETTKNFHELTNWLKSLENSLGRVRSAEKYSPRTIDLDVVIWNNKVIDNDVYEREFLKKAVLEVQPNLHL